MFGTPAASVTPRYLQVICYERLELEGARVRGRKLLNNSLVRHMN